MKGGLSNHFIFCWCFTIDLLPQHNFQCPSIHDPWKLQSWSETTLNYQTMMERYPRLKKEVGGLIPDCDISSLLDRKVVKWSTTSYALVLGCRPFVSKRRRKQRTKQHPHHLPHHGSMGLGKLLPPSVLGFRVFGLTPTDQDSNAFLGQPVTCMSTTFDFVSSTK